MGKNVSQMEKGLKLNGLSAGRKGGEKSIASKERIYLNHSGPFPIVFFLLPPSTPPFLLTRIIFLFRCSLPPSSLFFPLSFSASLVSLCQLMVGGMSVAGPHPSQTTAWMVPCSVQSNALQFCHNEG